MIARNEDTIPAKLVEVIEAQIKVWPRALEDVD